VPKYQPVNTFTEVIFMPDVPFESEQRQLQEENSTNFSECNAICVDAARIYDSCGAKDCLSDLTLMFTEDNQCIVDNACSVRICKASVITSTIDVESVAFHRGFYAVDMVFYFAVTCEVYTSSNTIPSTITGLATYGKRVVLYGSESCTKSFSSDSPVVCDSPDSNCGCEGENALPKATVQISNPMALSAKLKSGCGCNVPCTQIPECVANYFGSSLVPPRNKFIAATIGIFTITQLIRNVQILIPSYDYCVPRKECQTHTDDPCEAFSKIEFPTECFFPPNDVDTQSCGGSETAFECDCSRNRNSDK
jgi:hypothetical protein